MEKETKDNDYYKEIGFMCGLEIHQRLATTEKLFCSCVAVLNPSGTVRDYDITRFQRAVAGELGEVDVSAQFEEGRKRAFTYDVFDNKTCLVEIDEEPPHEVNKSAVDISLALAKAMDMMIVH